MTNTMFLFQYEDWRLGAGLFMIFINWQYNESCYFLDVDVYDFNNLSSSFQKSEKLESCHNRLFRFWSRLVSYKGPGA